MIHINQKENCCGCGACIQICPQQCITFQQDLEGFSYPVVNEEKCIHCNLCVEVCPELHQDVARIPLDSFVAQTNDKKTQEKSSSGGVFFHLAEEIIKEKGVVFGALTTDRGKIEHSYISSSTNLWKLQGSKYVQSDTKRSFREVRFFLQQKRKVLFSGTPCQIAGLRHFLRLKEYDELTLVEIACHGVPSPLVWEKYKQHIQQQNSITSIQFRSKEKGWNAYSLLIKGKSKEGKECTLVKSTHGENAYMCGFLNNLYLRPSCHTCSFRSFRSGAHLTLADAWGIEHYPPYWKDDKGTSLVFIHNTSKVNWEKLNLRRATVVAENTYKYNPALFHPSVPHPKRTTFFAHLNSPSIFQWVYKQCRPNKWKAMKYQLKLKLRKLFQ